MLGAFLRVDDADLLQRIAEFPSACVVVSRQPRGTYRAERLRRVSEAVKDAAGLPSWARLDFIRESMEYPTPRQQYTP